MLPLPPLPSEHARTRWVLCKAAGGSAEAVISFADFCDNPADLTRSQLNLILGMKEWGSNSGALLLPSPTNRNSFSPVDVNAHFDTMQISRAADALGQAANAILGISRPGRWSETRGSGDIRLLFYVQTKKESQTCSPCRHSPLNMQGLGGCFARPQVALPKL